MVGVCGDWWWHAHFTALRVYRSQVYCVRNDDCVHVL